MCISSWPLIPVCTSLQIWVRNKMLHFWYCTAAEGRPACLPKPQLGTACRPHAQLLVGSVHGGKGERNVQGLVKGWSGEGAFAKKNQLLLQRAAQSEREYQDPLSSMVCAPHSLEGLHAGGGCSKGRRGSVVTCHSLQVLPATSNDRNELILSERQRQLMSCNHKLDFGLLLLCNSSFAWGNGCNFINLRSLLRKKQMHMSQYIASSLCGGSWAGALLEAGWSQGLPFTICCN